MFKQSIAPQKLNDLTPEMFSNYLSNRGWEVVDEWFGKMSIWEKGEDQVLIPLNSDFADYSRRISEALESLSQLERRDAWLIYEDVKTAAEWTETGEEEYDILRLRVMHPETEDGTIPLVDGVKLYQAAYDILLSSASALHHKSPYQPNRKPHEVIEYMKHTRIGQSERGSYVIVIQSPTTDIDDTTSGKVADNLPENYGRQVLTTLAKSLNILRAGTRSFDPHTAGEERIERLVNEFVREGGSANFCDAIQRLHDGARNQNVEVNFTWSHAIDSGVEDLPNALVITPKIVELTTRLVGAVQRQWNTDLKQVRGFVVRLAKQSEQGEPVVVLDADVDGLRRRVRIHLSNQDDHRLAIEAYRSDAKVSVKGRLVKRGGRFNYLEDYQDFRLVDA